MKPAVEMISAVKFAVHTLVVPETAMNTAIMPEADFGYVRGGNRLSLNEITNCS